MSAAACTSSRRGGRSGNTEPDSKAYEFSKTKHSRRSYSSDRRRRPSSSPKDHRLKDHYRHKHTGERYSRRERRHSQNSSESNRSNHAKKRSQKKSPKPVEVRKSRNVEENIDENSFQNTTSELPQNVSSENISKRPKRSGWDPTPNNQLLALTPTTTGFTAALAGKSPEEAATLAATFQFKSQATQLCRIYVGSLDYSLSDQDIRQVFSAFGTITSIDMPKEGARSKGFCFIEYSTPESAELAINTMPGFMLKGRTIKVGRPTALGGGSTNIPLMGLAKTGGVNAAEAGQLAAAMLLAKSEAVSAGLTQPADSPNRIYVGCVPFNFTSEDIKQIFDVFGKILSCQLIPNPEKPGTHKGYGFIEYSTLEEANLAIETMNDFAVAGKILKVNHATNLRSMNLSTSHVNNPALSGPAALMPGVAFDSSNATVPISDSNVAGSDNLDNSFVNADDSPILLLCNMVNANEVNDDLKQEIRLECQKYGEVINVNLSTDVYKNAVRIFVEFTNPSDANEAFNKLHDRWFGGRRISARQYDHDTYKSQNYWS